MLKLTRKQKTSIKAILALLNYLDAVVWRLRRTPGSTFAPPNQAQAIEDYQRFLVLRVLYPDKRIRPTTGTDALWHAHILDTRRYHADCQAIFGEYLHHDPSVADGDQDAAMWEMYRKTFTPSAWGKPDPVLATLMLDPAEAAAKPEAESCETCA